MTVGERIKERRQELGINADTLAERLGVSRSTMFRYESGDIEKMPIDIIKPIAEALHIAPERLLGWYDDDTSQPVSTPTTLSPEQREYCEKCSALNTEGQERVRVIIDYEYERQRGKRKVAAGAASSDEPKIIHADFRYSVYNKASAGTGFQMGDEYFGNIRVRLDALPKGYEKDPSRYFGVSVAGNSMEPKFHDGDTLIVCDAMANVGDIVLIQMEGEGYVKRLGAGVLESINPKYEDIPIEGDVRLCGKVVGVLDPEAME